MRTLSRLNVLPNDEGEGAKDEQPCRYALLGLGKLGGREISYHSDLDLLLIYETEGRTSRGEPNSQYFTELAQRLIRTMSQMGPMGRLYAVDMRLRPTGKSGRSFSRLLNFRGISMVPAVSCGSDSRCPEPV